MTIDGIIDKFKMLKLVYGNEPIYIYLGDGKYSEIEEIKRDNDGDIVIMPKLLGDD